MKINREIQARDSWAVPRGLKEEGGGMAACCQVWTAAATPSVSVFGLVIVGV